MNPSFKGKLKIVGEPFTEELYGVAVQKGKKEILDAINKGLNAVLNTNTYDKLVDKWLR